jgi:hypothetical protein
VARRGSDWIEQERIRATSQLEWAIQSSTVGRHYEENSTEIQLQQSLQELLRLPHHQSSYPSLGKRHYYPEHGHWWYLFWLLDQFDCQLKRVQNGAIEPSAKAETRALCVVVGRQS